MNGRITPTTLRLAFGLLGAVKLNTASVTTGNPGFHGKFITIGFRDD